MPTQVKKRLLFLQRRQRLPLSNNRKLRSLTPTAKRLKLTKVKIAAKEARQLVLETFFSKIEEAKNRNHDKTSHRFVHNIVDSMKNVCPWITMNVINDSYRRIKARNVQDSMTTAIVCLDEERTVTKHKPIRAHREKSGQPKGSTNAMKTLESNCIIVAKNEIASIYQGVLNAKEANTIIITSDSICTRIKRRNIYVTCCTGDLYSPLLSIEAGAIEVMKKWCVSVQA